MKPHFIEFMYLNEKTHMSSLSWSQNLNFKLPYILVYKSNPIFEAKNTTFLEKV